MRRIAFLLLALALVGAYWACSADAPAPTPPNQGGHPPSGNSPLQIVLFTGDANPVAGTCTLIQAVVTLNGVAVSDGTGVLFSTDFGVFSQNGSPTISVVTQKGVALTSVCSNSTGTAFVNASANVAGNSAKAQPLKIVFQPSAQAVPFFSSCSPSFGANTGGTSLTINGGRFPGDATTTRATFTVLGITREAPVTSVTSSAVVVSTPAFPEATAGSTPAQITLTFLANSSPITLSVPNCFAYGTVGTGTPNITAVLPSSGTNSGNTRVSIIGTGFSAPVQVFFGSVEAVVVNVSFSQIVVLSPPAFGAGSSNLNQTVTVRVHEVNSGTDATLSNAFRFTPAIQITSWAPTVAAATGPFSTVTIFGQGFEAPVSVLLAGIPATPISVSATEIQVLPGSPLVSGCSDIGGKISVTNIDTGDTVSTTGSTDFVYLVKTFGPVITGVSPSIGDANPGGLDLTVTGQNFTSSMSVTFAGSNITPTAITSTSFTIHIPPSFAAPPACGTNPPATELPVGSLIDISVTNTATSCTTTFKGAFQYTLPCM
ncbi:MAG TPA: IPT/TIG domain-containing protein [Thermoanaerobaculia bacterium]